MDNTKELLSYIQSYYIQFSAGSIQLDENAQLFEEVVRLIQKSFYTLNLRFQDNFKNSFKDYFDLSLDSKDDEDLFNNIMSLIIVFAILLLNQDMTITKLRNLRDSFTIGSIPWERLNALSYFLQNQNEITNTNGKDVLNAHEEKMILHKLIHDSFKDRPIVVDKFSDVLFIMTMTAKS